MIAHVKIVSKGTKKTINENPKEIRPGTRAYLGFPLGRNIGHVRMPREKKTGQKNRI